MSARSADAGMNRVRFWLAVLLFVVALPAFAANETPLLESSGERTAYLDGSTIYLWSGRPVAYLVGQDVYGFNGKHLGWFEKGRIWNHGGHMSCTTKDADPSRLNPLKGLKGLVPAKAARETAPIRPTFANVFDDGSCRDLLSEGS